ncbi:MAG: YraN family protein [Clostridia bacterium]|nr:YraN family protein [Clostridia bacterium]
MKTVEIGRLGESYAAKFLKKQGYRILEKNKHQSHNEIDLIVSDKLYLVFVEVKTRSVSEDLHLTYGSPASAVDRPKQRRTVKAAQAYLNTCKERERQKQPRMDVIEVFLEKETHRLLKINHIINAFGVS